MRVLVCGSRKWDDWRHIWLYLDEIHQLDVPYKMHGKITQVIHGDAAGADRIAGKWALDRRVQQTVFRPQWGIFGKRAGVIRNQRMLVEGKPDLVVAFRMPGVSKGTDDMIARAERAGVKVEIVHGGSK